MDVFTKINWFPSLNDIVDEQFVDGERLEKESVLYRTLKGTFNDIFADIPDDFLDKVTLDHMKAATREAKEQNALKKARGVTQKVVDLEEDVCNKPRCYVPGIVTTKVRFPRMSRLSMEQQALCVRAIVQFSGSSQQDNIKLIGKNEMQTYLSLQGKINEEQAEFLEIAKANWDPSTMKIINEHLINRKWKFKTENVEKLHRYYVEVGTIPFKSNNEIKLCFEETKLQMGTPPTLILPHLNRRYNVPQTSVRMQNLYFSMLSEKNSILSDQNCLKIAESTDIDMVISTSGLKCLVNNLDPAHRNVWTLPIHVREVKGRHVIFIDKALPPTSNNILQKNAWIYKYILKAHFLRTESNAEQNPQNSYVDPDKPDVSTVGNVSDKNKFPTVETNFTYNIYKIGACGSDQNEMMKEKMEKDYKILVRTKTDGIEKIDEENSQCLIIAPKLENQLGLGAEAVTLEEASKQWASLTFRRDTSLVRVRIDSKTSEVIQYERRTATSVNNEMRRLYEVKGEDSFHVIYNVASEMTKMAPGKYLLRHTIRSGPFANVYKEAENPGKTTFDVQTLYIDEQYPTLPSIPWPKIDTRVANPMHIAFQRMPAMFYPSKNFRNSSTKRCQTKRLQTLSKKKKKNIEPPLQKENADTEVPDETNVNL